MAGGEGQTRRKIAALTIYPHDRILSANILSVGNTLVAENINFSSPTQGATSVAVTEC